MSFANVVSQVVSLVGVRNKQSVWDADMERVSKPKCLKMTCSRLNRCRFSEFSGGGSLTRCAYRNAIAEIYKLVLKLVSRSQRSESIHRKTVKTRIVSLAPDNALLEYRKIKEKCFEGFEFHCCLSRCQFSNTHPTWKTSS